MCRPGYCLTFGTHVAGIPATPGQKCKKIEEARIGPFRYQLPRGSTRTTRASAIVRRRISRFRLSTMRSGPNFVEFPLPNRCGVPRRLLLYGYILAGVAVLLSSAMALILPKAFN